MSGRSRDWTDEEAAADDRLRARYPHFDDLRAHEQRALVEAERDEHRQDDEHQ